MRTIIIHVSEYPLKTCVPPPHWWQWWKLAIILFSLPPLSSPTPPPQLWPGRCDWEMCDHLKECTCTCTYCVYISCICDMIYTRCLFRLNFREYMMCVYKPVPTTGELCTLILFSMRPLWPLPFCQSRLIVDYISRNDVMYSRVSISDCDVL